MDRITDQTNNYQAQLPKKIVITNHLECFCFKKRETLSTEKLEITERLGSNIVRENVDASGWSEKRR